MANKLENKYKNEYRKSGSQIVSDYEGKLNQQQEMINRLASQIEMLQRPKEKEKIEEVKIEEEVPRQGTRNDNKVSRSCWNQKWNAYRNLWWKKNLIGREEGINLAGRSYNLYDTVLNLIQHGKSAPNKNFKNAYEQWKRDKGDKSTFNNKKYVEEAIDILEDKLQNNKEHIAIVMKSIIDNNSKLFTGFNERYLQQYAKYYPKR